MKKNIFKKESDIRGDRTLTITNEEPFNVHSTYLAIQDKDKEKPNHIIQIPDDPICTKVKLKNWLEEYLSTEITIMQSGIVLSDGKCLGFIFKNEYIEYHPNFKIILNKGAECFFFPNGKGVARLEEKGKDLYYILTFPTPEDINNNLIDLEKITSNLNGYSPGDKLLYSDLVTLFGNIYECTVDVYINCLKWAWEIPIEKNENKRYLQTFYNFDFGNKEHLKEDVLELMLIPNSFLRGPIRNFSIKKNDITINRDNNYFSINLPENISYYPGLVMGDFNGNIYNREGIKIGALGLNITKTSLDGFLNEVNRLLFDTPIYFTDCVNGEMYRLIKTEAVNTRVIVLESATGIKFEPFQKSYGDKSIEKRLRKRILEILACRNEDLEFIYYIKESNQ